LDALERDGETILFDRLEQVVDGVDLESLDCIY
jgi:hypothetical protein